MFRNSSQGYGWVSVGLHWLMAILFVGQIGLGYATQAVTDPALQFDLYQWHKSTGFLLLALALLRLTWRLSERQPDDAPSSRSLQRSAKLVHLGLFVALFAVPLTGWAVASTSVLDIPSYVFNLVVIPPLPLTPSDAAEAFWSTLHATLAYGAAALIASHAGAALWHQFIRRDGLLRRMWFRSA
ncbi:cytochrome b [Oryzibacter oryziterrae]|uniref:cytochrome b n=1 Tax=Oryzibacter oryziterrae TaxID=2766474 RepID=UPI001F1F77DA|nr:cytochrome b [Oryzibacter oryziterrae]